MYDYERKFLTDIVLTMTKHNSTDLKQQLSVKSAPEIKNAIRHIWL